MKDWIIEKINAGVIVQGLLAVGMAAVVGYLAIAGAPIPDVVAGLAGAAFGFYFGNASRA
jgi:hypothetical protein